MVITSAGNRLHLLENHPELLFSLSYISHSLQEPRREEQTESFLKKIPSQKVDIIYIFGVSLGEHYACLKSWLHEKRERRLIFLEEDLCAIAALLESPHAEAFFTDSQVILHFLHRDADIEEIAWAYPSDQIEVTSTAFYQKTKKRRLQQLRLKLYRQSAVAHALLTESLYAHKMLPNLLRNINRWQGSFSAGGLEQKFRNIPAVICGAGPSLQAHIPLLKRLEDRALIIAGGSAITALSNQGVQPHLGLALDPNQEEFSRLKTSCAFEMPLIYGTRLQPDVFNAIHGARGYLVSDTGGPCERYFERQMEIATDPIGPELGQEALSVTTLAIAFAVHMGCNPIILDGIDLAYTGMQRYARGVLPSSQVQLHDIRSEKKTLERLLRRKDIHGQYVHTLVKWVMESECIAAYAKTHPQTRFINVSQGGLGFPGIRNQDLSRIMEEELSQCFDLRAQVHAEIQHLPMPPLKEKTAGEMQAVYESLLRLKTMAQEMLEELERVLSEELLALPTGKMAILESDFQEEKAFECLFPTLGPALDRLLARASIISPHSSEEEQRRVLVNGKIAKWKQWQEMIDSEIAVFRSFV